MREGKVIMKLVKRALATTTAVLVGGTMFAGIPAHAAGTVCDGNQVKTCISVRTDGPWARAAARVTDVSDGTDFQVKTTHVVLQTWHYDHWATQGVTLNKDFDGWHDTSDLALSSWLGCNGSVMTVRAKARFDWKRAGADYEWMTSKPVVLCQ